MISISIVMIIGFTNTVYTITKPNLQYQSNDNPCSRALHVKMFDNETVPKYIIGRGHEIIPVNPATTDVLVNECTLEPMGVS
jgi:hypothetical protein